MGDDGFFAELVAAEFSRDSAVAHHEHTVGYPQHLGELGGDYDDAVPVGGKVFDQMIDFGFGADVDAAGRLIEKENARAGRQPPCNDRLLLIAAAEKLDLAIELKWPQIDAFEKVFPRFA